MGEAELLAASHEGVTVIRVRGRGTFKVSTDLRRFGAQVLDQGATGLILDLAECTGLDSTFMGVMAMLGLRGQEQAAMVVVNATPALQALLQSIGLSKLWGLSEQATPDSGWVTVCHAAAGALTMQDAAETVLDAHRTLMQIDADNVPRFQTLVDMLSEELGR